MASRSGQRPAQATSHSGRRLRRIDEQRRLRPVVQRHRLMGDARQHHALGAGERKRELHRSSRVQPGLRIDAEHAGRVERRHAVRRRMLEHQIAHFHRQPALGQRQRRRWRARNELVVDQRYPAGGGQPQRVLTVLQLLHQIGVARVTQYRAAHGGRVQIADVEVDQRAVRLGQRPLVCAFAIGAGKQLFRLRVSDPKMADQPAFQQRGEIESFVQVSARAGGRSARAGISEAQLGARHRQTGGEYRLVHDAHRGGGLGHAIQHHPCFAAAGARVAVGGRHGDFLFQAFSGVLLHELAQWRLAQSAQEYRLVLAQHFDIDEAALAVDGHQQIHRRAFEAGNGCQIDRFEHIADRAGFRFQFAGDRPHRQIIELRLHMQWGLEAALQCIQRQLARLRTGAEQEQQKGEQTADRGRHEGVPAGLRSGCRC
jgi:hypothetical protein